MMGSELQKTAKKLANAFKHGKLIKPINRKFCDSSKQANILRSLCEEQIKSEIIGFKAGGTGKAMLKKWGEKEPFYASIYKRNFRKSNSTIKINKYNLGIELEVFFYLNKNILLSKKKISEKNITKYLISMGPCIEVVGYRQKKKGLKTLGDLISDFGANISFINGSKKKYKKINFKNLKTELTHVKSGKTIIGNTKSVYDSPIKSLIWLLNKVRKNKQLNKNFYVFTGSTVGVVPIKKKGLFEGNIEKIGKVKAKII
ncbi:MAG: fumarylacetoacetate hydrolase [Candidatus Pelagibacter sp.]|nr:fumarylacetoacetate hydrolase [Candidatus Pelagibacter sp.]